MKHGTPPQANRGPKNRQVSAALHDGTLLLAVEPRTRSA